MSTSILGDDLTKEIEQDYDDYLSGQHIYKNREEAATRLAAKLKLFLDKSTSEFTILAIPRGGVVTGNVVASSLRAKMDIVVSRKIGAPHSSELAIGAIMHDGSFYPNQGVISMLKVPQIYLDEHIFLQKKR